MSNTAKAVKVSAVTAKIIPLRFCGIPEQNFKKAKIVFIPVPYDATTSYKAGTRDGPLAILLASFQGLDEPWGEDEWHPAVDDQFFYTIEGLVIPHGSSTKEHLDSVYQFIKKEVVAKNKIPFLLGGEHSLTFSAAKAVFVKEKDFSILHFDAHTDLRDSYGGDPYSHACVLRRSFELGPKISLTSVGVRSADRDVRRYIKNTVQKNTKQKSLHMFYAPLEVLEQKNLLANFSAMEYNGDKYKNRLTGNRSILKGARLLTGQAPEVPFAEIDATLKKKVYITFDLDAFDSSLMPAVGTPQPGGLNWYQATGLLDYVIGRHEIIGMDIVELAPIPGSVAGEFLAAKLAWKMVEGVYDRNSKFKNQSSK